MGVAYTGVAIAENTEESYPEVITDAELARVVETGLGEDIDVAAYEAALLEEKRNLHAYLKSYERYVRY